MRQPREIAKPTHKKIARLFTASLMSNRKWRKLFGALDRPDLELSQAIVKLIDEPQEHVIGMPKRPHLRVPYAYIDLDNFGPMALSSIEWIEIPAIAEYQRRPPNGAGRITPLRSLQDLDKVREALAGAGQFPVEDTPRGLRIVGHVPRRASN